jgi:hypothetical protein
MGQEQIPEIVLDCNQSLIKEITVDPVGKVTQLAMAPVLDLSPARVAIDHGSLIELVQEKLVQMPTTWRGMVEDVLKEGGRQPVVAAIGGNNSQPGIANELEGSPTPSLGPNFLSDNRPEEFDLPVDFQPNVEMEKLRLAVQDNRDRQRARRGVKAY